MRYYYCEAKLRSSGVSVVYGVRLCIVFSKASFQKRGSMEPMEHLDPPLKPGVWTGPWTGLWTRLNYYEVYVALLILRCPVGDQVCDGKACM